MRSNVQILNDQFVQIAVTSETPCYSDLAPWALTSSEQTIVRDKQR